MRDVPCEACGGARLKPEILAVTIAGRNIADVCAMSVGECHDFIDTIELTDRQRMIAERVLKEINARLRFLVDVGLDYLSAGPAGGHAVGGRGAADPAGDADRFRASSACSTSSTSRASDCIKRDNHRLIETVVTTEESGQHPDRRRTRRGHDPDRGLGGRHWTRGRRDTWRDRP
jgi:excinuclease ABC subunit A